MRSDPTKWMELLQEGDSMDVDAIAASVSVQMIGPQFNRAQLLETLEKGQFIRVDPGVLRSWYNFVTVFHPELYGAGSAATVDDSSLTDYCAQVSQAIHDQVSVVLKHARAHTPGVLTAWHTHLISII